MNLIIRNMMLIYQKTLSPILVGLGCSCRFHPTCSEYAMEAVAKMPLRQAALAVVGRLLRCGPWHPGGVDFLR